MLSEPIDKGTWSQFSESKAAVFLFWKANERFHYVWLIKQTRGVPPIYSLRVLWSVCILSEHKYFNVNFNWKLPTTWSGLISESKFHYAWSTGNGYGHKCLKIIEKTSIIYTLCKVRILFCSPLILKKVSKTYLSLRSQVTPWSVLNYLWINGRRWYACRWNPQCSWVTLLLLIRKSCSPKHPKRPSLRQNYNDSSQMFQIYKGFDCNEHFVLIFGT